MRFLIIALVIVIIFILLRQLERYRWRRYCVERERYFQRNPLRFQSDGQFAISLALPKHVQIKLINAFMWKLVEQCYFKKVFVQKEERINIQIQQVKVTLGDIHLGYLETHYAQQLCKNLNQTDFMVGRPVEVLAEIQVICQQSHFIMCKMQLDLPKDTTLLARSLQ